MDVMLPNLATQYTGHQRLEKLPRLVMGPLSTTYDVQQTPSRLP